MGAMMPIKWKKKRIAICIVFLALLFIIITYHTKKGISEVGHTSPAKPKAPTMNADWDMINHSGKCMINQEKLDHIASTLGIKRRVVENMSSGAYSLIEIILTNNGKMTLFGPQVEQWEIVYSTILPPKGQDFFSVYGNIQVDYGMMYHHVNGQVHKLIPTNTFGTLDPGKSKILRQYILCCSLGITDGIPNWYVSAPGCEPKVIESTAGESLSFVAPFDSSTAWKTFNKHGSDYDIYNPPLARDRFDRWEGKDYGEAVIPVIPSPYSIQDHLPEHLLKIKPGKWSLQVPIIFSREAKFLTDEWKIAPVSMADCDSYIVFEQKDVVFDIATDLDEAYELQVHPDTRTITIKAPKKAGAFYAVVSLLSLANSELQVPQITIKDAPRFRYRGYMLDAARNFFSKEKILRVLDVMSMYKLNKFHFHLTDDEGWRLEIPDLPELTELGSVRCHDPQETKCLHSFLGSGPDSSYSGTGHYSVEDYKEILQYATERHIEVIPEIDMPGHSHAAVKAMMLRYNRFIEKNDKRGAQEYQLHDPLSGEVYRSVQGFRDNVLSPCLNSTFRFAKKVMDTLIDLHKDIAPLRIFHVGGDEVPEGSLGNSASCNFLKPSLGASTHDYQGYFSFTLSKMLDEANLNMAVWEDSVYHKGKQVDRKKFPAKKLYTYVWNASVDRKRMGSPYKLANGGYQVVLTPAAFLYLDHPQEENPLERGIIWATRYTDTYKVFRVMPFHLYWTDMHNMKGVVDNYCLENPDLCPELTHTENIEGLQATLFGEYLRKDWIADYMTFPRLLAVAERAWHEAPWERISDEKTRENNIETDWFKFANTLGYKELARLDKLNIEYRIPPPGARIKGDLLQTVTEFPGLQIQISEDNGVTWLPAKREGNKIQRHKGTMLRTKAAGAERYSKVVYLSAEDLGV